MSRFLGEISESLLEKEASRKSSYTADTISNLSSVRQRYVESIKQKKVRKQDEFVPDADVDYENQSQEEIRLKVGVYVEHEVFGKGKVTQLSGRGDSAKAVVQFNNVGPKNLMIKFARLKVLGAS